jgi:hypothetical protein
MFIRVQKLAYTVSVILWVLIHCGRQLCKLQWRSRSFGGGVAFTSNDRWTRRARAGLRSPLLDLVGHSGCQVQA